VAIAEIEIGVLVVDREIDDGTRRDVRQIHVAAPIVRLQRGHRLDLRADAQRPDEGLIGQRDLIVELDAFFCNFHLLDPLRQRRVEERGVASGNQAAELGNQRRGADGLRPARLNIVDVDAEYVALFRTFHRDRSALRVEEGDVQELGRLVALLLDRTLERVLGFGNHDVARLDLHHRIGIGAIDIVVFPLLRLGQLVRAAGLAFGDGLSAHIGSVQPGAHARLLVKVPDGE
jgi:hypothetical protein